MCHAKYVKINNPKECTVYTNKLVLQAEMNFKTLPNYKRNDQQSLYNDKVSWSHLHMSNVEAEELPIYWLPSPVVMTAIFSFSFYCTLKSMHLSWSFDSCLLSTIAKWMGMELGLSENILLKVIHFRVYGFGFLFCVSRPEHRSIKLGRFLDSSHTSARCIRLSRLGVKHALLSQIFVALPCNELRPSWYRGRTGGVWFPPLLRESPICSWDPCAAIDTSIASHGDLPADRHNSL